MHIVQLTLKNNNKIRIQSDHPNYLKDIIDKFAIHVKNYYFNPKFKSGIWDGKIRFISETGLIPYGLLFDFIKVSKKLYPDIKLKADKEVKQLFKSENLNINYNLKYYPRYYQKEAIEICLKHTKGIIVSATASGKSLGIAYIIKILLNNRSKTNIEKAIIIVPNIDLVNQFKDDLINYGISEKHIGRIYGKVKEWDKTICISTWQTMKNNTEKINLYNCIIIDEVHKASAKQLKKILMKSKAKYRFGFTGTLPEDLTKVYSIKSYLGPVLREYPSGLLADQEFISKCTIKMTKISYTNIESKTYLNIKDEVFNKRRRLKLIENIINKLDDNVLLLVSQINEGEKLEKLINRKCKNKKTIFLSGRDKDVVREKWRKKMINENNIALIATYQIFSTGLNIPSLKYLILASSTQSKIRTLQSIGRILRLFHNKKDGGVVFDIIDEVKYLKKHGEKRIQYYKNEGHKIKYFNYDSYF